MIGNWLHEMTERLCRERTNEEDEKVHAIAAVRNYLLTGFEQSGSFRATKVHDAARRPAVNESCALRVS